MNAFFLYSKLAQYLSGEAKIHETWSEKAEPYVRMLTALRSAVTVAHVMIARKMSGYYRYSSFTHWTSNYKNLPIKTKCYMALRWLASTLNAASWCYPLTWISEALSSCYGGIWMDVWRKTSTSFDIMIMLPWKRDDLIALIFNGHGA